MKNKVFVEKINKNIEVSVTKGLRWIDFEKIITKGARVSIKPNYTYPHYKEGVTTSTEVIEALVKSILPITTNIAIVESDGGRNAWKAEEAFKGHGLDRLVKEYSVQLVNLSKTEWDWVEFHRGSKQHRVPVSSFLTKETDVFISVPVPKVHCMTGVTYALKNQWGCVPDVQRLNYHYIFSDAICAINKALKPAIIVGDARYMLNVNGPMYGSVRKEDLIIVSNDLGAFEVSCAKLMGIDADKIPHLRQARLCGILPESLINIEYNVPLESFGLKKFILRRTLRNWVVLTAFKSKFITWLFYGPSIGAFLHIILYFFKKPDHLKDTPEE